MVMWRIAINGFGRIGRCVTRALYERGLQDRLQLVAINELADSATIRYLTRFDSNHGRFPGEVELVDGRLLIEGQAIELSHQPLATDLDWSERAIDLVLECTGQLNDRAAISGHLEAGARRVLVSQPATPDLDLTLVYGINEHELAADHQVVSAASCTTNCVVPVIKLLDDAIGIEAGVITTIHSAMNDQPVLDSYHHTDLRKTRGALHAVIPIDTGLAVGIGRVLPALAGRFEAQALRVPVSNVSCMDMSLLLKRDTSVAELNTVLRAGVKRFPPGVLGYTAEPLASCDFNHDAHSAIVDSSQTQLAGRRLAKVLVWFDNEWGYANRMLDIALHWQSLINNQADSHKA